MSKIIDRLRARTALAKRNAWIAKENEDLLRQYQLALDEQEPAKDRSGWIALLILFAIAWVVAFTVLINPK